MKKHRKMACRAIFRKRLSDEISDFNPGAVCGGGSNQHIIAKYRIRAAGVSPLSHRGVIKTFRRSVFAGFWFRLLVDTSVVGNYAIARCGAEITDRSGTKQCTQASGCGFESVF